MTLNRYALVALAAASTLFATRAAAQACVEVDTDRDTLSDQDRNASRSLLLQALEQNGERVARGRNGGAKCSVTYTVSTVRLGSSVSTTVTGPQGTRTMSLRAIEDLPNAYDQIVRSLHSGREISETSGAMTRDNVTANQAAPRRAEADSLWYARIGGGLVLGGSGNTGPAFGCGYRYELDSVGIDISFFNLTYSSQESAPDAYGYTTSEPSFSGSWARLVGYYFMTPKESASLYFGGGLSWGGSSVMDGDYRYGGSGIQGELSAGFEVLRASTLRLFVQIDATLPFYSSDVDSDFYFGTEALPTDSRYTPTVMVSIGGGFTRSNTLRVNLVP